MIANRTMTKAIPSNGKRVATTSVAVGGTNAANYRTDICEHPRQHCSIASYGVCGTELIRNTRRDSAASARIR